MLEKNRLIHPGRRRKQRSSCGVDPNAEIMSAFINQTISQAEGFHDGVPLTGEEGSVRSGDWMDEHQK